MTVLSRLFFSCDSAARADSIVSERLAELEQVKTSTFPEVTVHECSGQRTVQLVPGWLRRRVAQAPRPQLQMSHTVQQRGSVFELVIEIGPP